MDIAVAVEAVAVATKLAVIRMEVQQSWQVAVAEVLTVEVVAQHQEDIVLVVEMVVMLTVLVEMHKHQAVEVEQETLMVELGERYGL